MIGVPTRDRPVMLKACLGSIGHAEIPDYANLSVTVLENGPLTDTTADICQEVATAFDLRLDHINELEIGGPSARNALITAARNHHADYLLFVDDDQIADRFLVKRHLETALSLNADIGGGYVGLELPPGAPSWASSVTTPPPAGFDQPGGTGNCLIKMEFLDRHNAQFDTIYRKTGGEDTAFFRRYIDRNTVSYYDSGAIVYEPYRLNRLTYRWQFARNVNVRAEFVAYRRSRPPFRKKFERWMPKIVTGLTIAPILFAITWACARKHSIHHWLDIAEAVGTIAGLTGFRFKRYKVMDGQ